MEKRKKREDEDRIRAHIEVKAEAIKLQYVLGVLIGIASRNHQSGDLGSEPATFSAQFKFSRVG